MAKKSEKKSEGINIDEVVKDPICQKWITYSTAQDPDQPVEWFKDKASFWEEQQTYLEERGFTYGTNIGSALDQVTIMKQEELEGCLLIVKIGSDERPASPDDINLAYKMLNEVLEGVKGVRVIVTHHAFGIEKISLPQLRALQSSVLASTDPNEEINPIIDMEL